MNSQGITSWSVFYLIKEKGVIDAGAAAVRQLTAKLPEFSFRSFFVIG